MTARGARRLLLHIGMHKTGSSSIQESFKGFVDADRTRYATIALAPNHGYHLRIPFEQDIAPVMASLAPGAQPVPGTGELRAFLEELEHPTQDLIVSGEAFSTFDHKAVGQFLDTVAPSGRHIEVLCYLRDPITLPGSFFQQHVKEMLLSEPVMPAPEYQAALTPWLDLLPRDQFTFRKFTPSTLKDGNVFTDFCDWAGVDPVKISEKRTNTALPDGCVRLLWQLNRLHNASPKTADHIAAYTDLNLRLRDTISGPAFTTPIACLSDTSEMRATLGWVVQHTGIDFRPEVEAAAQEMKGRPLGEELNRIDSTTRAQLGALLNEMKVFRHRRAPVDVLMARLYRSAVKRARWQRRRNAIWRTTPRTAPVDPDEHGFRQDMLRR